MNKLKVQPTLAQTSAALASSIFLLSNSGVKTKLTLDLSIEQICLLLHTFGGTIEMSDSDDVYSMKYKLKEGRLIVLSFYIFEKAIDYTMQLSYLQNLTAVFAPGCKPSIIDGYLVP
jgi:hypothetical protein